MAISSINIQTATAHSFKHNDRTDTPSYLVDSPSLNECNLGHKEAQNLLNNYVKEAEKYRKDNGLRAMKKDTIKSVEAVVNLNASHTLKDVEKLAKTIEKEFGFRAVQIAIHRDEGKDTKNKNYHAHIVMCNLTTEGKTIQRTLGRDGLKKLQDITAKELCMVRGKEGSKAERLDHKQYKAVAKQREAKENEIVALKTENEALKYNFREYQQRITALDVENTDLKKELHRLNTQVNKGKATVEELEQKIASLSLREKAAKEYSTALLEILPTAQKPVEVVQYVQELKKDLSQALQSKNELQAVNHTLRVEKMDFRATQSVLNKQVEELKTENESLKKENEKLTWYKKQYQAIVSSLKKWTSLEDVRAVMQSIKDKFQEPKAQHIETVDEFEKALPLRSIHTATGKIRKELQASSEPEYLKIAKEHVLDEFERQRLQAVIPNVTLDKLDDIKAVMQNLKERFEAPKSNEQDYQKHFMGWCHSTNFLTKQKLLEELNTHQTQALINTLLVAHQVPAVLMQDSEKFKQKLEAQVQTEKDHMAEITARIEKENEEFKEMFSRAKQKGPELTK